MYKTRTINVRIVFLKKSKNQVPNCTCHLLKLTHLLLYRE